MTGGMLEGFDAQYMDVDCGCKAMLQDIVIGGMW